MFSYDYASRFTGRRLQTHGTGRETVIKENKETSTVDSHRLTGSGLRKVQNDKLRSHRRRLRSENKVLDEILWSSPPFRSFTSLNSLCENPTLPNLAQNNIALERIRRFDNISKQKNKKYLEIRKPKKCGGVCITLRDILNDDCEAKISVLSKSYENADEKLDAPILEANRIQTSKPVENAESGNKIKKASEYYPWELEKRPVKPSKFIQGKASDNAYLHQVINLSWNNRLDLVKDLVLKHMSSFNINDLGTKGYNALQAAGQNCNIKIMTFLISCGASPWILDANGRTLFEQVQNGIAITNYKHRHHRKNLIEQALAIANPISIFEASHDGNYGRVKWLLDSNESIVNEVNKNGMTPLHYACLGANRDTIMLLLQRGANPELQNSIYQIPFDLLDDRNIKWLQREKPELSFLLS